MTTPRRRNPTARRFPRGLDSRRSGRLRPLSGIFDSLSDHEANFARSPISIPPLEPLEPAQTLSRAPFIPSLPLTKCKNAASTSTYSPSPSCCRLQLKGRPRGSHHCRSTCRRYAVKRTRNEPRRARPCAVTRPIHPEQRQVRRLASCPTGRRATLPGAASEPFGLSSERRQQARGSEDQGRHGPLVSCQTAYCRIKH